MDQKEKIIMASNNSPLRTASNYAYKSIKDMISQYQLIPGQKVTYDQLAVILKMSKTPIINALNRLEQEEFVASIPNRGFFIKEIDIKEIEELFKVRKALEILSIEESIKKFDSNLMKEIENAMIAHREYNYFIVTRKRLSLDATFHLKISEMSCNRSLSRLLKHILEQIYLRYRSEGISPDRLLKSAEEHQKIFDAIKERNMPEGTRLMGEHIEVGKISTMMGVERAREIVRF